MSGKQGSSAVVLLGSPGVGKDEQSKLLIKGRTHYINVGDACREHFKDPTSTFGKIVAGGGLVSDDHINELFAELIGDGVKDGYHHFVVNGAFRTPGQGCQLEVLRGDFDIKDILFLYLEIPRHVAEERLALARQKRILEGRKDVGPEEDKKRLDLFEKETLKAIRWLSHLSSIPGVHFHHIDGTPSVEVIAEKIRQLTGEQRRRMNPRIFDPIDGDTVFA